MSVLLFRLNSVPEDEAADIRQLLIHNNLSFYETSAGKWGISTAAIWLTDATKLELARSLIDAYQNELSLKTRQEYAALSKAGKIETLLDRFIENPFRYILNIALIFFFLYISIKPFLDFGK